MATRTSSMKSVSKVGASKSAAPTAKSKANSNGSPIGTARAKVGGASIKGATIKSPTSAPKRQTKSSVTGASFMSASSNGTGQKIMDTTTTTKNKRASTAKNRNGQASNNGSAIRQSRTELDIEYFRSLLLSERGRLEAERDQLRNRGGEMDGAMPEEADSEEDTADMASAMMDKEFDLSVEDEVEELLLAVDHALQKMDDGTYGVCDMSGEPIPRGRLELIPWASLTVECQALSEGE